MYSIHESKKVLGYWIKKIKESKEINERNKDLILDFYKKCTCQGLTHSRSRWYLAKLCVLARMTDKTFSNMRRSSIKEDYKEFLPLHYFYWLDIPRKFDDLISM